MGQEMHRKAYNFIPQSIVADKINREGLIYLYYNQDLFRHVQLLNQVHDSIVLQIPLSVPFSEHAEIIKHLRDHLQQPVTWMSRKFVIPLDGKIGFNLGKYNKDKNPKGMVDIKIANDADITYQLTSAYEKLQHGS